MVVQKCSLKLLFKKLAFSILINLELFTSYVWFLFKTRLIYITLYCFFFHIFVKIKSLCNDKYLTYFLCVKTNIVLHVHIFAALNPWFNIEFYTSLKTTDLILKQLQTLSKKEEILTKSKSDLIKAIIKTIKIEKQSFTKY